MEPITQNDAHADASLAPKHSRIYILPYVIVGGLMAVSFWIGYVKGQSTFASSNALEESVSPQNLSIDHKNGPHNLDFNLFWKSWDLLKDKYVDKANLNANEMMYGAIKGMLASTNDPYTTFFDPKTNEDFKEEITGSFQGIGAEIGIKDGILTIVAPLEDSPAQKAGLLAGDKILKINNENTSEMDVNSAVKKIRGEKGTEVTLTIYRADDAEQAKDFVVKRDSIVVKSVKSEFREDGVAIIKVTRFGDDTSSAFRDAISQVVTRKSKGLVIDVRNNPGGYLDAAVDMASLMLPKKEVIVMEEDGNGKRKEMYSKGGDMVSGVPTILLINEGSASASEILAGALRDNRENVTLVGQKSYGKGSVQELIPVSGNTAVKITVARWLTPKGKQINHEGIAPDIEVENTKEDRNTETDAQLNKAIEVLQEKLK